MGESISARPEEGDQPSIHQAKKKVGYDMAFL
jgi:hypothetical protein